MTARPGATGDTLRAHGAALAAQHGVPVYPKPRPHVLTADWQRAVGAVEVAA